MTDDTTTTPAPPPGGRVEPVDLQVEMQRSYLDYAMSVIVGRALPDVRDGLKPVHRRVLYAMYDGGYRPDRGFSKSSRVVGDVMGQYHPHGDTAIYDTLVRLAQPWSLRYPLVQGQGNFGSPGDDKQAAMRYCVGGDTRVRTYDRGTVRIADLAPDAMPNSDTDVDLKVLDRNGDVVRASKVFHSGDHPTLRVTTTAGHSLTGTHNHPVLCLVPLAGIPTLLWKLLAEIAPGDRVVLARSRHPEVGLLPERERAAVERAGRDLVGNRSATSRVPEFVWRSGNAARVVFLRSLFTGDGSASVVPRKAVQVSYATRSEQLAREVQQMLLEQGVVSKICRYLNGEIKVVIGNRRDVRLFSWNVGFLGRKQIELEQIVSDLPAGHTSALSADHVPYLADYLREQGARTPRDRSWLKLHDIDCIQRWEREGEELRSRLTDEALGVAEPLVDGRFFFAEVTAVTDAGVQAVYSLKVETDDHAFLTDGFVSHNTECRLAPLAMEMVRDIDEETVDFSPNYDGRQQEPDVLPARFPNLLVNGSGGIAVGMATNIPPHNLREIAGGVQWYLQHPDAPQDELLRELLTRVKGPDFPTRALIVGTTGIEQAYRTGRGSVVMRAVVDVEEDSRGRSALVVTELPYQVNPDALIRKIAELADSGKVPGIADLKDDSSSRTGMRIRVVLKRDAVPTVVRNNLFKHTQLQDTFGCNMVALVDGVPRTLPLDAFVRHWVAHQIEVIRRRTEYRLRKRRERLHIVRALLRAIDVIDEVIALIRGSASAAEAQVALQAFLEIDEIQARAILDLQLRKLAALERQELQDEHDQLVTEIAELERILESDTRKREIISEELAEIVDRYGDERRTRIVPAEGEFLPEDLIPEEPVVVTITRGGYAKRTRVDSYRSQRRGGKGVRGTTLREDDVVTQFFVTTTHHWILFFTNRGRVYRAKAYELPEAAREARGQHVANLLAFQPDEHIARVLAVRDYEQADYLVLATKHGYVKKTRLTEYDSNRSGGVIAMLFRRDDDELIGAELVGPSDDLLLVSRQGQAIRFTATDEQLRPMGRATGGVHGMKFRTGDELLSMAVVRDGTESYVFTVTDGGYAKRTVVEEYRVQGRGGLGIKAMKIAEARGSLVGALVVGVGDEVLAIRARGGVTRSPVIGVPVKGRDTMGVKYVALGTGDAVVAIARNAEDDAVTDSPDEGPTPDPEGDVT